MRNECIHQFVKARESSHARAGQPQHIDFINSLPQIHSCGWTSAGTCRNARRANFNRFTNGSQLHDRLHVHGPSLVCEPFLSVWEPIDREEKNWEPIFAMTCLLYTSDAADE